MANPFEKRATEYLRDNAAFLSIVAPEPLHTFFEKPAKEGKLYDRLTVVIGTPGSGKTTISTLMQYRVVQTLLDNPQLTEYKPLANALKACGILESSGNALNINYLGCRLPMESEYRDFWELPYSQDIKMGLLKSFLQARAMLSWLRSVEDALDLGLTSVELKLREGASAAEHSLGATDGQTLFNRAKEIERAIYEIGTALVPPAEGSLSSIATRPYHPFDSIEYFILNKKGGAQLIKPMVMLDDVHTLHPDQLLLIINWLSRREMKIARWMLMRMDAQTPHSVLFEEEPDADSTIEHESPIKTSRERTKILLQSTKEDRVKRRSEFRTMARSMADKYLRLMPVFSRQGLTSFPDLLNTAIAPISATKMEALRIKVETLANRAKVSRSVYQEFLQDIEAYFSGSPSIDNGEDVKLAMMLIMLHRYVKRAPQAGLFEDSEEQVNFKHIKVNSGLADGARILLMHEYSKPYYYGIEAVCDGSSENAEQFLQLAGELVNAAETRIIRSSPPSLPSVYQHKLLTERTQKMVQEWEFPKCRELKRICKYMTSECLSKSLEPNAPLGGGANAVGILQEDFEKISRKHSELSKILKFGVAYNALSIKRDHLAKNRTWTLIELSGPLIISNGLTLHRGGFVERTIDDLLRALIEK